MTIEKQKTLGRIMGIFEGTAGARFAVYLLLIAGSGIGTFFAMKGAIDTASAQSASAVVVNKQQETTLNHIDDRLDFVEYEVNATAEIDKKQTEAIEDNTETLNHTLLIIERIATKLNVSTGS